MRSLISYLRLYGIFIFAIIISLWAINSWSLWLDESSTAFLASQESLTKLISVLKSWSGSESQMPCFVMSMFLWEKLFGHSEYALRSFNLAMVAMLLFYVYWQQFRKNVRDEDKKRLKLFILLTFLSPIIVYNLNEARVNFSIYAIGTISLSSTYLYCKYRNNLDWTILLFSFIMGFSYNLLFIFIGLPIVLMLLYHDWTIIKNNRKSLMIFFSIIAILLCYYVQTLLNGSGGMKEKPGIVNIAYALYELLGFGGVSIPKNELRNGGLNYMILKPYIIPSFLLIISYCGIIYIFMKVKRRYHIIGLFGFSFFCFYLLAYVMSFRFWGRHLLMLYPIFIFALSDLIYVSWKTKRMRMPVVFFICIIFWGTIRIIVLDCYKKENVKKAIQYTNDCNKKKEKVLYLGFSKLAEYYGLNHFSKVFDLESQDSGFILYHKSMGTYYKMKNKKVKQHIDMIHEKKYPFITLVWEDRDSELYQIKSH